jgi:hypothetical protein
MTAEEFADILERLDLSRKQEITMIIDGLAVMVRLSRFVEPTSAVPGAEGGDSNLFELDGTVRLHDKPFTVGALFVDPTHISAVAVEYVKST